MKDSAFFDTIFINGGFFAGMSEEQKKSQEVRGGMIDIEHAKQEFENYLDEYDRQDEQIYLKIEHTYGVVKYAGEIARRMECSREDVELAELSAASRYRTF